MLVPNRCPALTAALPWQILPWQMPVARSFLEASWFTDSIRSDGTHTSPLLPASPSLAVSLPVTD